MKLDKKDKKKVAIDVQVSVNFDRCLHITTTGGLSQELIT